ncbi:AAA family ATPase [Streptomyces sp. NPDC018045]|uniref:AAA family ATPase n=1 Tax=unclassified Streptomyces TaxID=2593676 RepID=UPI00379792CA
MTDAAARERILAAVPSPPVPPAEEQNPTQARLAELRSLLVDTDGLDSIADPEPLIDGVLYRDSLAWLYGKPGHGKSFVALDWAGCIANGMPWQHREVRRGPVLYLVAEGASGIRRRVRAWEQAFGQRMHDVVFLPVPVQLLHGTDLSAFTFLIREQQPALVVIDTQARVTVGAEENSNTEMGRVVAAADALRQESGACVLMVHHAGKSGLDMRGASAFDGAATSVIKVTKDGEYVEVHSGKQKDTEDFDTVFLRLRPAGQSAVLESREASRLPLDVTRSEETLLATMRESFGTTGATGPQLFEVCDVPKSTFYRSLNSLLGRGALVNIGTEKRAHYKLPAALPAAA